MAIYTGVQELDVDYKKQLGLVGNQLIELTEAVDDNTESIRRSNGGGSLVHRQSTEVSDDSIGSPSTGRHGIGTGFSRRVPSFNMLNAYVDISDPLIMKLSEIAEKQEVNFLTYMREMLDIQNASRIYLKGIMQEVSTAPKNLSSSLSYMLNSIFSQRTRHVFNVISSSISGLLKTTLNVLTGTLTTGFKILFGGFKQEKSDTDRIIDAIEKQTEWMMNRTINQTPRWWERIMSGGVLGFGVNLLARGLATGIGSGRERAQDLEDRRARGEEIPSGFFGSLFFGSMRDWLADSQYGDEVDLRGRGGDLIDQDAAKSSAEHLKDIKDILGGLVIPDIKEILELNALEVVGISAKIDGMNVIFSDIADMTANDIVPLLESIDRSEARCVDLGRMLLMSLDQLSRVKITADVGDLGNLIGGEISKNIIIKPQDGRDNELTVKTLREMFDYQTERDRDTDVVTFRSNQQMARFTTSQLLGDAERLAVLEKIEDNTRGTEREVRRGRIQNMLASLANMVVSAAKGIFGTLKDAAGWVIGAGGAAAAWAASKARGRPPVPPRPGAGGQPPRPGAGGTFTKAAKAAGVAGGVSLLGGLVEDYAGPDTLVGAAGGVASDTAAGAGAGALLGSVVPVLGTGVGAAVGGAGGAIMGTYNRRDVLFGDAAKPETAEGRMVKDAVTDSFLNSIPVIGTAVSMADKIGAVYDRWFGDEEEVKPVAPKPVAVKQAEPNPINVKPVPKTPVPIAPPVAVREETPIPEFKYTGKPFDNVLATSDDPFAKYTTATFAPIMGMTGAAGPISQNMGSMVSPFATAVAPMVAGEVVKTVVPQVSKVAPIASEIVAKKAESEKATADGYVADVKNTVLSFGSTMFSRISEMFTVVTGGEESSGANEQTPMSDLIKIPDSVFKFVEDATKYGSGIWDRVINSIDPVGNNTQTSPITRDVVSPQAAIDGMEESVVRVSEINNTTVNNVSNTLQRELENLSSASEELAKESLNVQKDIVQLLTGILNNTKSSDTNSNAPTFAGGFTGADMGVN